MQALVNRLNDQCDRWPFQSGWYLKHIPSGGEAQRRGDVIVPSASTRKISILMTALSAVNEGLLSLNQHIEIQKKYQYDNSGVFQYLQPGFRIQLRDVLTMMIIVSDNTSTGTVVDMLGLEKINAFCRSVGMKHTIHRYGIPPSIGRGHSLEDVTVTTPEDQGLLLHLILKGARDPAMAEQMGCTPALCQLAIDILTWQKLKSRLPSLLPMGTVVAHKTGTGQQWRNNNDAGIIFFNNRPLFILSVFTENVPLEMPDGKPGFTIAGNHIAQLCRTCYDEFTDEYERGVAEP